jgi:hypothetical protein
MKKIIKFLVPYSLFLIPFFVLAQDEFHFFNDDLREAGTNQANEFAVNGAGYGADATLGGVVATLIQAAIALLGIIFVVLMVYAGFRWLLARGNEEEVTKAKSIIRQAFWGLVITLAAWSIAFFIVRILALGVAGGGAVDPNAPPPIN